MDKDTFIRKSTAAGGYASTHNFQEIMANHSHQPFAERFSKSVYAKLCSVVLPQKLRIGSGSYDFLSAGGQQLVYGTESDIVKIIAPSLSFEAQTASAATDALSVNYSLAKEHMGEHITDTKFDLRRLRGGLFAAIALQPRIKALHEFKDVSEMIHLRDDAVYMDRLQSLLDGITSLYASTGLQVDLNGPNNIFLTGNDAQPQLELVDTIIVTPEMQARPESTTGLPTGETITRKMNLLRSFVSVEPIAQT